MKSNDLPQYKNIRLKSYNYSNEGYYYVTICTNYKECTLCKIAPCNLKTGCFEPKIITTDLGKIVDKYINNIATVYSNADLDCYIIMPNHIHLIVVLTTNQKKLNTTNISLPKVVNSLKTITSKEAGFSIWQKNYYEHIIRCEQELCAIREYIENNPFK